MAIAAYQPSRSISAIGAPGHPRLVEVILSNAPYVIGLIFAAGSLYAGFAAMKKNLNGVGTKIRGIQEANEQRYLTIVVVTMLQGVKDEEFDRYHAIAKLFLDAAKGRHL